MEVNICDGFVSSIGVYGLNAHSEKNKNNDVD